MKLLMRRGVVPAGEALPVVSLTLNTNYDSGYNIATNAGSLSVATLIVVTLNPSWRIKQITSGTFPSGSRIRLVNLGAIYGPNVDAIYLSPISGLASIEVTNGAGYILADATGYEPFWNGSSWTNVNAAGAPGKAIALNGATVTWISGNDATHVRGAVS